MSVDESSLLAWCQRNTTGYPEVDVNGFGECWRDGLAFCALIHKFHPEKIDFDTLTHESKKENLTLAFQIGQQLGISHHLKASAFESPELDSEAIIAYLSHFYNTFHITQLMTYSRAPIMNDDSKPSSPLLDRAPSSPIPSHLTPSLIVTTPDSTELVMEKVHSVTFIPTTPTEESLRRSPSPFKMRKYPESDGDGKTKTTEKEKKEKEPKEKEPKAKPKAKTKEKEKEKPTKEKETKPKSKTTTKTTTKTDSNKSPKSEKATKLQRPPSSLKSTPPSTAKTPRTGPPGVTPRPRPASAPPARPPSATPGKTPRKDSKTPRATVTPRANVSPRKGATKDKEEKEKKTPKKTRPTTPSSKSEMTPTAATGEAQDRIRLLEIENSQLKAKLNEYKVLCDNLETRLANEMELRKKVVQQLQGFKMPDD